jgi:hypothetical protein
MVETGVSSKQLTLPSMSHRDARKSMSALHIQLWYALPVVTLNSLSHELVDTVSRLQSLATSSQKSWSTRSGVVIDMVVGE